MNELPDASYSPLKTLTHTLAAGGNSEGGLRKAAVEILVPLGPRSIYGLLGGHFNPLSAGKLVVDVKVSASSGRLLANSLPMNGDEVRIGLPAEYANAVLSGMDLAKSELESLISGHLSIDCSAHAVAGSSESIFMHLASIVVRIFNGANVDLTDDELKRFFPARFS